MASDRALVRKSCLASALACEPRTPATRVACDVATAVLGGTNPERSAYEWGRGRRGSGTGFGGRAVRVEPGVPEGNGFWSTELLDGGCELDALLTAQDRRLAGLPIGHGLLAESSDLDLPVGLGGLLVRTGGGSRD